MNKQRFILLQRLALLHSKPQNSPRLIYEGKLKKRILYLKCLSLTSSLALSGSYGYVLSQKGLSVALAGVGFAFTPFILSPIVIAWFFKRYINKLYYEPETKTFTANHYGLLLNQKECKFKKEDVIRLGNTSLLNTFKVGGKPFYMYHEDIVDAESIQIYKELVGESVKKDDKANGNSR